MEPDNKTTDLKMDPANLYREETFTDQRAGTIRRLSPVTADGAPDAHRKELYIGQAQMLTPMGAIPLAFEIDADSLDEAITKFGEAAQAAVERTVKELEDMRREAASSLVIPGAGGGGLGGLPGGAVPGGVPGGGKIQLR